MSCQKKKEKNFYSFTHCFLKKNFPFAIIIILYNFRRGESMQEDFLTKIRSAYNQFTKAEKKVADYILQNPDQVLFMSISDLAETCKVGGYFCFPFL